jgi:LPS O-antigen subunit length determinant protein (WzzB/FepE family)
MTVQLTDCGLHGNRIVFGFLYDPVQQSQAGNLDNFEHPINYLRILKMFVWKGFMIIYAYFFLFKAFGVAFNYLKGCNWQWKQIWQLLIPRVKEV